jgi:hypothetical protein
MQPHDAQGRGTDNIFPQAKQGWDEEQQTTPATL